MFVCVWGGGSRLRQDFKDRITDFAPMEANTYL